jgi:hypothetical protein
LGYTALVVCGNAFARYRGVAVLYQAVFWTCVGRICNPTFVAGSAGPSAGIHPTLLTVLCAICFCTPTFVVGLAEPTFVIAGLVVWLLISRVCNPTFGFVIAGLVVGLIISRICNPTFDFVIAGLVV